MGLHSDNIMWILLYKYSLSSEQSLKALLRKLTHGVQGNGVSELWHDANVSDGEWHKITTVFRSDRLEISVDGDNRLSAPNKGTNKHIDLTDRLFIGGMELKKKTRAIRKAFKTNALSI